MAWARERGAAAHLDGARLWESAAGYGRTPAEIAALFDTVYVSFYKGIGALAGCCVAGPADVIAQVREWRRRMGGTLYGLWPSAASALTCLAARLPRFPAYLEHARAIAAALSDVPGVTVIPDPPQVPMMHLLLRASKDDYAAAARRLAKDRGIWTPAGVHADRRSGRTAAGALGRRRHAGVRAGRAGGDLRRAHRGPEDRRLLGGWRAAAPGREHRQHHDERPQRTDRQ